MEVEDLQTLCIPRMEGQQVDALLFDPMPGGSGLLEQKVERWAEVCAAAVDLLTTCPSACQSACIDCLLHFRNAHYHHRLNRHEAVEFINACEPTIVASHPIPPRLPADATQRAQPAHRPEFRLRDLLRRAGLPEPQAQHPIPLGPPWGSTTPDFFYPDPSGRSEGVCIYLDGLSEGLHGNPLTATRDNQMREALRERQFEVIPIPASALNDRDRMITIFYRLARLLMERPRADEVRNNAAWFEETE